MELRPYQQQAKDAIFSEWKNGIKKTLLVLPTGCGKTIVFAKVAEECVKGGSRVLILAHRGELLDQAADKIGKSTGLGCATEKAEQTCLGSWFRIVVGSVQSMMREKRLNQFPNDYFNTIIIDEAHHCISDSYQKVLRHFPDAEVLGVTATPDRGDMQNLGTVFESLAYEYTLPKAIKEGYLSPIKAVTIPLKIDMSAVGVQAGDFKSGDIATALDPYLESIAEEMEKYCSNKKTVVFLPLVKTSQKFRDILNNHGFKVAEVNGDSKDRAEILEAFDKDQYNVLCNSMLLTEGWDCPSVDCIVVLRPTKVRSLYCQMVGRGTRLSPETNKDHALDGSPMNFPINGAWDKSKALMVSGDFSQLVFSIRQDITFKLFTEGVVQNTDGTIAYNLMQNDMVALRAVMRMGWEVPNPINALAKDKTKRCPFSILKAGE